MKNSISGLIFLIISIYVSGFPLLGNEVSDTSVIEDNGVHLRGSVSRLAVKAGRQDISSPVGISVQPHRESVRKEAAPSCDIYVTEPGELSQWLESVLMRTDSVAVHGPIGAEDFSTLWEATFYGGLEVINLECASVEEGIIPQYAFINIDEQFTDEGFIPTLLRHVILPNGITVIDDFAFAWSVLLEEINFPAGIQSLGTESFSFCQSLHGDIVFDDGLEHIGNGCFSYCIGLRNRVEFPPTLASIGTDAFYDTPLTEVSFQEGLESIGARAFEQCYLEEAVLPQSCRYIGDKAFAFNRYLKRAQLPERLEEIPERLFYADNALRELTLPAELKYVGPYALSRCAFRELYFPEGFEILEYNALEGCAELEELHFPSTFAYAGTQSCVGLSSLRCLYCAAPVPPFCEEVRGSDFTPFGLYDGGQGTPRDIPVYVPIGTAEAYRSIWGWDYFTEFIETADFPSIGVGVMSIGTDPTHDTYLYDLYGRRVQKPVKGQIYICNGKKILWNN